VVTNSGVMNWQSVLFSARMTAIQLMTGKTGFLNYRILGIR